jgi:phosphate transport system substrate-binding protein
VERKVRHILLAAGFICALAASASAQEIRGSGSTFAVPLMAKWIEAYEKKGGGRVVYQPTGSAAVLNDIRHDIVDFAVSEAPLDNAQLLRDGLTQFPLVIGAIVPVVNVDGISAGQLRVTGPLLADIYLGKITKWNDPAIAAINPELRLPDLKIHVVHRSDGSGSSFTWADYLSKVSGEWKTRVGAKMMVDWPTGVGFRHSSGVAESVASIRGAIGYLDYGNAVRKNLAYALVRNRAGNFIAPGLANFQTASREVDWGRDRNFFITLTDAQAADAYPIMALSLAVIRSFSKAPGRAREMRAFFQWTMETGQDMASSLQYVPLPPSLIQQIEGFWRTEKQP